MYNVSPEQAFCTGTTCLLSNVLEKQRTQVLCCVACDHPCTCNLMWLPSLSTRVPTNCMQYCLHYSLSLIVGKSIRRFSCYEKFCRKLLLHLTGYTVHVRILHILNIGCTMYLDWLIFHPCMSTEHFKNENLPIYSMFDIHVIYMYTKRRVQESLSLLAVRLPITTVYYLHCN